MFQQPVLIASQSILHSVSNIPVWVPGALYVPARPAPTVLAGLIALMALLAARPSAWDHQPELTCSGW